MLSAGKDDSETPAKAEQAGATERRSMLIIEDDPRTNSVLQKIFLKKGWEVRSATTITEGLELLEHGPQVVILDMMLPDGDGLAVLKKVRADRMPTQVVVTTGLGDADRIAEIWACQPTALLFKPVDLATLMDAMGNAE